MKKEVLKIIYKQQKEEGNFYFKTPNIIYIKPDLKKELEAEVLIHEFIHFLERRYPKIIGTVSEQRTMVLGKYILRLLKRKTKY